MTQHRYLPMTNSDEKEMLQAIGVETVDELFQDIPEEVRFKGLYKIKKAKSESALLKELMMMANKNADLKSYTSFLGAGVYDHYIPSVVDAVISRSEFYTAYTPYQPEISQGELQAIFEFQTMICELTGMDVANSSMYDGPTALAEAALLCSAHTKRKKVLVSETVHPQSRQVLQTYAKGQNIDVVEIPQVNGQTDFVALEAAIDETVGGMILQYPNFFGQIEDLAEAEKLIHEHKALMIVSSNPLSLGVLQPPGEFGADIVIGDTQVFGIATALGGPHCGYFAVSNKLMRKVPGRLVGQTVDENGKRGFVLTLQAREQHIRRDKATSNICSNQALNALASSVAMSALGKNGIQEMALQNIHKTQYAKNELLKAGFKVCFEQSMFNELVVKLPHSPKSTNLHLLKKGIIGGYDISVDYQGLDDCMLFAFTEIRTKEEIDTLVAELGDYHGQ